MGMGGRGEEESAHPVGLVRGPRLLRDQVPAWYHGPTHLALVVVWPSAAIATCLLSLDAPHGRDWLMVPLAVVFAFFTEYVVHRFPMHRRMPGGLAIFEGHGFHHRYFTWNAPFCEGTRDWFGVLLPPHIVLFIFGVFVTPEAVVLHFLWSPNASRLFVAVLLAFYLGYELVHFCCHAPAHSFLARLPVLRWLRELHHRHHDPYLMRQYNFNIVFPIFDYLFRTIHSGDDDGGEAREGAVSAGLRAPAPSRIGALEEPARRV